MNSCKVSLSGLLDQIEWDKVGPPNTFSGPDQSLVLVDLYNNSVAPLQFLLPIGHHLVSHSKGELRAASLQRLGRRHGEEVSLRGEAGLRGEAEAGLRGEAGLGNRKNSIPAFGSTWTSRLALAEKLASTLRGLFVDLLMYNVPSICIYLSYKSRKSREFLNISFSSAAVCIYFCYKSRKSRKSRKMYMYVSAAAVCGVYRLGVGGGGVATTDAKC
jgi:hypothetical protein